MKKLATTTAVMLIAALALAQKMQEKNVPALVKTTFQKKYPTAIEVKWDREGENYEASFDLDGTGNSVLMDARGSIIESEAEIEPAQLPKGVLDYVKKHYTGRRIKECAKITDAKGAVTYEVETKRGDLIFDNNGKFVRESKG